MEDVCGRSWGRVINMIKTHCNKTLGTNKILIPLKIHIDLLVWVSVTPFSSRGIVPIRTNN